MPGRQRSPCLASSTTERRYQLLASVLAASTVALFLLLLSSSSRPAEAYRGIVQPFGSPEMASVGLGGAEPAALYDEETGAPLNEAASRLQALGLGGGSGGGKRAGAVGAAGAGKSGGPCDAISMALARVPVVSIAPGVRRPTKSIRCIVS